MYVVQETVKLYHFVRCSVVHSWKRRCIKNTGVSEGGEKRVTIEDIKKREREVRKKTLKTVCFVLFGGCKMRKKIR